MEVEVLAEGDLRYKNTGEEPLQPKGPKACKKNMCEVPHDTP